jgi:ParB family chromosome partitioning protein
MAKRKLGRGLDALLGGIPTGDSPTSEITSETVNTDNGDRLKELPVEFMQRGKYQPRRDMHPEALEELASSIKAQGVMQPIVVRPVGADKYEIIAGERRWRATQQAGLDTIPCIIRDVPDEAAIAMALIENIQREDLNAIEEAQALIRLQQEFELTQQQVADAVGKSRAMVANLMRLMSLQEKVRKLLEHGDLEMGHGRALLALEGVEQIEAAHTVVSKGLTVRQTEELVRKLQQKPAGKPAAITKKDPDTRKLENDLSEKVGAPVAIQQTASGKGKLVFSYNSLDELEGILNHIR